MPSVFICYARGDMKPTSWLSRLKPFLAHVERTAPLAVWHDEKIDPGSAWREEISKALDQADAAILLIGVHFFASDFVMMQELPSLLQQARTRGMKIFPLVVGYADYKGSVLGPFEAFNDPDDPLEKLPYPEQQYWLNNLAIALKGELKSGQKKRPPEEEQRIEGPGQSGRPDEGGKRKGTGRGRVRTTPFSAGKSAPIQVYCDADITLDWFSLLAAAVKQRFPSFDPQILYLVPGGATLWRRMSGGNDRAYSALRKAFLENFKQVIDGLDRGPINLVDLGVGNFEKGLLILDHYLEQPDQELNYFPLDVSYDMLNLAFNSAARGNNIVHRIRERGNIIGIHSTFANLNQYNHLFGRPGTNIFLFLGNTLGNELSEKETLRQIKDGMNVGDILVTELQLIEPEPDSAKELTELIQPMKYFYASPFTNLGFHPDDIDLVVEQAMNGKQSQTATTYNIYCGLRTAKVINHPLLDSTLHIPDERVLVYTVRKYQEFAVEPLFRSVGFDVLRQRSTVCSKKGERRFHYITARKVPEQSSA
jgi:hypothetical protein